MDEVMQWECCGAELLCTLAAGTVYPSSLPAPHVGNWELGSAKNPSPSCLCCPVLPSVCQWFSLQPHCWLVMLCGPLVPHYPLPTLPQDS